MRRSPHAAAPHAHPPLRHGADYLQATYAEVERGAENSVGSSRRTAAPAAATTTHAGTTRRRTNAAVARPHRPPRSGLRQGDVQTLGVASGKHAGRAYRLPARGQLAQQRLRGLHHVPAPTKDALQGDHNVCPRSLGPHAQQRCKEGKAGR